MNPVIEVNNLRKSYGELEVVKGLSLSINKGEIFAILGPNGAGKTTTVEILEGFRTADSGTVRVLDIDPAIKGQPALNWRDRIGIVLQSTQDTAELTVREAITHFASYYSNPRAIEDVIALVGLTEKSNDRARTLSGGQRRRLDVGLGIIGNPEVLFLDEPTTGFDPEARRAFWLLIKQLRDEGTTILLTTHYLDEAEALADRVAVMNQGEILEISTPALLGGRATAQATVSWSEGGVTQHEATSSPTEFVKQLSERLGGEIPELSVHRPSLEDIYLSMIGATHE
jgi:ABC-2 type transport system ATP-binding protein